MVFAITCVIGSFVMGVQTAGEVRPVDRIEAQANLLMHKPGDIDGDGNVTVDDAILALRLYEGKESPTDAALAGDPDRDGSFTLSDLAAILRTIQK